MSGVSMFNTVVLFYTSNCNISCRHCFISPLQNGTINLMSDECFNNSIDFCSYVGTKRIIFSGGEPLLYYNKLFSMIELNSELNIKFSLCTNASWAYDEINRKRFLRQLKSHNFDMLEISTDSFHQQFVSLDHCVIPLIEDA